MYAIKIFLIENTEIDAQYACFKTSILSFFQTLCMFGFEDLDHAYQIFFISTSILSHLSLKTAMSEQVI